MVDGVGTTAYSYTSLGQLESEDGPWASDTVSYTYNNRLRDGLSVAAPNASDWVATYDYDAARRLTEVTSPAGVFGYTLGGASSTSPLIKTLSLPGGSTITNAYDSVARLLSTDMRNSSGSVLNSHDYGYNQGNQRTQQVFTAGNYVNYTYDSIGQLTKATGRESGGSPNRLHEQLGYTYDAAGNLNYRTNNDLTQTFSVNSLNELSSVSRNSTMTVAGTTTSEATSVTVLENAVSMGTADLYADFSWAIENADPDDGNNTYTAIASDSYGRSDTNSVTVYLPSSASYTYDGNGNLTSDGYRAFTYDDENQLIAVLVTNDWKSEFEYDGKMRRRIRHECTWSGSAWVTNQTVRYIYDGNLVIQERDGNNIPNITYTRGTDLSGSMEGAGGIGGLLAKTDHSQSSIYSTVLYHADGNGNITSLASTNGILLGRYHHDPFGNTLSINGAPAEANLYRFSSKEYHPNSGLVHYLYRYYDSNLQRWINRDPIQRVKESNLYTMLLNQALSLVDPDGLRRFPYGAGTICTSKDCNPNKCKGKYLDEDDWDKGFLDLPKPGKCADADAVAMPSGDYWKIPDNCTVTVQCYATDRWRKDGTAQKGKFKGLRYTCSGLATPRPTPAPVPPFPPNPY